MIRHVGEVSPVKVYAWVQTKILPEIVPAGLYGFRGRLVEGARLVRRTQLEEMVPYSRDVFEVMGAIGTDPSTQVDIG